MNVRVLLLDDHEIVRIGLRSIIDAEPDLSVVAEAGTATEALAAVERARPDVAVVDLQLADGNGVEVCRLITAHHPGVHCLVLSGFADHQAMVRAVAAGAAGYVLKQRCASDLVGAIRVVAGGGTVFDPALARAAARRPSDHDEEVLDRLSGQEQRILALIAEGATTRQIARDLFLSERTVKNYTSSLLTKLGMARRTEAAVYGARLVDSGRLARSKTQGREPPGEDLRP